MKKNLLISVFLLLINLAFAQDETPTQVNAQNRSGQVPFSASIGTSVEHVDTATGSLSVRIPIVSVPGRGMNTGLTLRFDSAYWVTASRVDVYGNGYYLWNSAKYNGWQTSDPLVTFVNKNVPCSVHSMGTAHYNLDRIYIDGDGGQHPFATQSASGGTCSGPGDLTGPDLTGQGMFYNTPYRMANGMQALGSSAEYTDPNGNQSNSPTDTLGRTIYTVTTTGSGGSRVDTYTYVDSNGTSQNVVVTWEQISGGPTAFSASTDLGTIHEAAAFTRIVVQSITLPNGTQYQFQYETAYGGLSQINLPTGGYITYAYSTYYADTQTRRYVSNRTEHVNGMTNSWTIALPSSGGHSGYFTIVTDPLGN